MINKSIIKIAWLLDDFPSPYQGYIVNLYKNLDNNHNIKPSIFSHRVRDLDGSIKANKVSQSFNKLFEIKRILTGNRLSQLELKLAKFDIVHIQHSFLYPMVAELAKRGKGIKFVITFRGADSYIKPWISSLWVNYHKEIHKSFDAIQVMSNNQKEYLKKWGYSLDKIYSIPISTSTGSGEFIQLESSDKYLFCI